MISVLLKINKYEYLERLVNYGHIDYVSHYTNIVGMKCTIENYNLLKTFEWVYDVQEATTGELLDDKEVNTN